MHLYIISLNLRQSDAQNFHLGTPILIIINEKGIANRSYGASGKNASVYSSTRFFL